MRYISMNDPIIDRFNSYEEMRAAGYDFIPQGGGVAWAPIIAGATGLLSGLFGSKNKTQTIDKSPWGPQQPYLKYGFGEAQNLYQNWPMVQYPYYTTPNLNAYQLLGLANTMAGATGTNPVVKAMQDFYINTLNAVNPGNQGLTARYGGGGVSVAGGGGGAGSMPEYRRNPYLDKMADLIADRMKAKLADARVRAGLGTNSVLEEANRKAMADALSQIEYKDYNDFMNRAAELQRAAISASAAPRAAAISANAQKELMPYKMAMDIFSQGPNVYNLGWADTSKLFSAGDYLANWQKNRLLEEKGLYDWQAMEPWKRLSTYMDLVGGNQYGGTQQTITPPAVSPWAQGIGTALQTYGFLNNYWKPESTPQITFTPPAPDVGNYSLGNYASLLGG